MKKITDVIILTVVWSIIFAPLYLIFRKFGIAAISFVTALYLVFLFVSFSYKHFWSFETFKNMKGTIKFFSVFFISLMAIMYVSSLVYKARGAYEYLVNKDGLEGIEYQADEILGFKPLPGVKTFQIFSTGDKIPIAYDRNGFRIPISDITKFSPTDKTGLLFLGDSFTFGAGCLAEETFPFLVAKETNLSYINAGISSYGLAQMTILAERLIPEHKPDYVVVQYSPWLASRAISMYAPVSFFLLPFPYFAKTDSGYVLEPPAYISQFKAFDAGQVKSLYKGKFIRFLLEKALPFYLQEVSSSLKTKILLITGKRHWPATNQGEVERYALNKIKTIAEQNGATLIILNLGDIAYSKKSHNLFSDGHVYFAEADSSLNEFLKTSSSKDYCMEFCHWKSIGKDYVLVDEHPNSKAHRLIADSIIQEIKKIKTKQ
jgi:hypothetical protein